MTWILTHTWIALISGVFLLIVLVLFLPHIFNRRKKDYPKPERKVISSGKKVAKDPLLIRLPKLG